MGKMGNVKNETATRLDIYNNDKILLWIQKQIKSDLKSKVNLELIGRYDNLMTSLAMSKATRVKHLRTILNLTKFNDDKDWSKFTKEDAINLVAELMRKYSPDGQETHTTWDHKKILKIFVRWVMLGSREFQDVGDPEATKWIKLKRVRDTIARENLLNRDDMTKLLHTVRTSSRDYALFDVQFEAGTRPGEILNLKVKHVKFDDNGAIIKVDGKTGSRPVRLIRSAQSLASWLNAHPFRNDPEAPLWPILTRQNNGKALSYQSVRRMLYKKCLEANLGKRVYLNLFRHSEATDSATYMTEAQMKLRHGWTNQSKMPSRYVHLVQSDVEKAIFQRYGITQQDNTEILFKVCPICKTKNHTDTDYCENCTKPLDLKTALEKDSQIIDENTQLKADIKKLSEHYSEIKNLFVEKFDSMNQKFDSINQSANELRHNIQNQMNEIENLKKNSKSKNTEM